MRFTLLFCGFTLCMAATVSAAPAPGINATTTLSDAGRDRLRSRLLDTVTRHLDAVAPALGNLKGKSADGMTALAYSLVHHATGQPRHRAAAVTLADGILADMRQMKFGVLYIKEKEKDDGTEISGGGPPALGWYAAAVLAALQGVPGREADLVYVGRVLDEFPYNPAGWWAATIDIRTGVPKQPLSKPSPINKNAALAMAAGLAAARLEQANPELAARLKGKVETDVYAQIIRAQEPDGFWHYNLNGNDPRDKDVLGYFMLTAGVLIELQRHHPTFREPRLTAALQRAGAFCAATIVPMVKPGGARPATARALTPGTPARFDAREDLKRLCQLVVVLAGTGHRAEAVTIAESIITHFPHGEKGADGAHAAYSMALVHSLLAP